MPIPDPTRQIIRGRAGFLQGFIRHHLIRLRHNAISSLIKSAHQKCDRLILQLKVSYDLFTI
ncbi:MAG: hypothetical protein ACK5C9_18370 [Pseudanabaena sp.]